MATQQENFGLEAAILDLGDILAVRPFIDESLDPMIQAARLHLEILYLRRQLGVEDADPVGQRELLEQYADYIVANVRQ